MSHTRVISVVLLLLQLSSAPQAKEIDDFACVPIKTQNVLRANRARRCRLACKQDTASCVGFFFDKKSKKCVKAMQVSDGSTSTQSMFCTKSTSLRGKASGRKMSCEGGVSTIFENFTKEQCDFQCSGKEKDYIYDSENKQCLTFRERARPKSKPKDFCHIIPMFKNIIINDEIDEGDNQGDRYIKKCTCFDEADLSLIQRTLRGDEPYALTKESCQIIKTNDKTTISIMYGPAQARFRSWGYTVYTTNKEAGCYDGDIKGIVRTHDDAMDCIEMIVNTCSAS